MKSCTYIRSTKLKIIDAEDSTKLQAIGCPGMIQVLYIVVCIRTCFTCIVSARLAVQRECCESQRGGSNNDHSRLDLRMGVNGMLWSLDVMHCANVSQGRDWNQLCVCRPWWPNPCL